MENTCSFFLKYFNFYDNCYIIRFIYYRLIEEDYFNEINSICQSMIFNLDDGDDCDAED